MWILRMLGGGLMILLIQWKELLLTAFQTGIKFMN